MKPEASLPFACKRNGEDLGGKMRERVRMAAQLCRVLAARQSAQMTEKHQQNVPAAPRLLTQRPCLPSDSGEAKLRSNVSGSNGHVSRFSSAATAPLLEGQTTARTA
jgi:hypothetical protein